MSDTTCVTTGSSNPLWMVERELSECYRQADWSFTKLFDVDQRGLYCVQLSRHVTIPLLDQRSADSLPLMMPHSKSFPRGRMSPRYYFSPSQQRPTHLSRLLLVEFTIELPQLPSGMSYDVPCSCWMSAVHMLLYNFIDQVIHCPDLLASRASDFSQQSYFIVELFSRADSLAGLWNIVDGLVIKISAKSS